MRLLKKVDQYIKNSQDNEFNYKVSPLRCCWSKAFSYCWSPTNNLHSRVEGNYEVNGLRKTNPIATAEPKVNRVNAFSRSVFAKMLPTVFSANTTTKIQSMMWITLTGNLYVTKSPFINSIHIKKRLMAMEVVSKTYISWSF